MPTGKNAVLFNDSLTVFLHIEKHSDSSNALVVIGYT